MRTMPYFLILIVLLVQSNTYAQDNSGCGEVPTSPGLIDGASASMEELVANSKEVKAFIAQADEFLDCQEKAYSRMGSGSKSRKERLREEVRTITKERNDIGDRFNTQIAAYKKANPK